MRLGTKAKEALAATVTKALESQCVVTVPARNPRLAHRIFQSVDPHLREFGAKPRVDVLSWSLPNGSLIRIAANGTDAAL